jgi:hypothetical protein
MPWTVQTEPDIFAPEVKFHVAISCKSIGMYYDVSFPPKLFPFAERKIDNYKH